MFLNIERAVLIGHPTNDLTPEPHLGGGVSYMTGGLKRLGIKHIDVLTMLPSKHPYIDELESYGATLYLLSSKEIHITSFDNQYTEEGDRTQLLIDRAGQITKELLTQQSKELFKNSLVVVTPVIGEVDENTYPYLKNHAQLLAVLPQGYFRAFDQLPQEVKHVRWKNFESYLREVDITILSNEDLTIDGEFDSELLKQIKICSPITILTQGARGAIIFYEDKEISISTLEIETEEAKDFTGAGEVFAAGFLAEYIKHGNLHEAGVFGCLYATIKVLGIGGIGLNSIPTQEQIETFIAENTERFAKFLAKNNLDAL